MLKMGFKALLGEANAEITTVSAEEASGYIENDDIQFVDVRETQAVSYTHLTLPTNREV